MQEGAAITPPTVRNFGRNTSFAPRDICTPRTEAEVLDCLERFRGRRIRPVGRLHSWSAAPVATDVLIDLRQLNRVEVERRGDEIWARIGAGCQIKQVLQELERQAGVTLPSIGLITEQTLAGAAATGTHGSGKHSLSHSVAELRVATYDPQTGRTIIREIASGAALTAARCALGCLGIVVSLSLRCRPQYFVDEHFRRYDALNDVLAAEAEYPLQQFYLIPWSWAYYAQHRREVPGPRRGWATLYRAYFFCTFDLLLHVLVTGLARGWRSRWAIHTLFRYVLPCAVVSNWRVVDRSQAMLVMEHELFRHIEIEVFVRAAHLPDALAFVRELLRYCDGDPTALSTATLSRLEAAGLETEAPGLVGVYTHHYPICIRRVLPDDTLLSMSNGADEDSYAISLISYARPANRSGFFTFAAFLTHSMARLFGARPHWGKVCPLTAAEAAQLYPRLPDFQAVCREFDPTGVFRNDWVDAVLFPQPSPQPSE